MRRTTRGFTLIELLVAMGVMALMAMMSWQGLDGMHRAQSQTAQRADELLALQAGLSQWGADLDAMVDPTPTRNDDAAPPPVLDWDGRALRLVRRSAMTAADGWLVVAWTRRGNQGAGQWLRWQSPPLKNRGALQLAWQKAALWAQNPGDEERQHEVSLAALTQWQIFYYRNNGWSNPLSASTGPSANPFGGTSSAPPDGIRLVLTLPPGHALAGVLTRDWVPPAYGGSRS
ncbi:type II secretion system protein J [Rhodoferax sp.]|uniref:PulJ/GspJ family protein n=1 Tax=Rhodoferax sp. TaxID=50421 RepID=UPI0027643746|nr:prepilin-type N-terminal cleavage/methylation domain-containing protein [Rhodoferax sp.]